MCNGKCWGGGCVVSKTAKVLLIIGGLNWGLVGLGMLVGQMDAWNLVKIIFGSMPMIEAIIYVLVGVSALVKIFHCRCAKCKAMKCEACAADGKMGGSMDAKM